MKIKVRVSVPDFETEVEVEDPPPDDDAAMGRQIRYARSVAEERAVDALLGGDFWFNPRKIRAREA